MSSSKTSAFKQKRRLPIGSHSFLDQLPVETRLLIEAMKPADAIQKGQIDNLLHCMVDWETLISTGRRHGAMPLFYRTLKEKPDDLVPANIKTLLRNDFHRIGLLITMQIRVLNKVLSTFNESNIPLLFFKGIQLGQQAYGNPIWRKPGDLDILIRAEHFVPAKRILTDLNFTTRMTELEEREQIDRQQQLTFYGATTDVDVHFSLQQRSFLKMSYASTFDSEDVWKRSNATMLDNAAIPCLSAEDQFCLLCVHSAKHGWYRLYMLADIAAFMTNVKLNWGKISIRAKRIKAERMLGLSVLLAHKLFQIPIPSGLQKVVRKDNVLIAQSDRIIHHLFDEQADDKPLQFHRIQAGLFPKWSEKAQYFGYVAAEHLKRKLR